MDLVEEKLNKGIIHPFSFCGEFLLFDSSTNSIFSIPESYYKSFFSEENDSDLLNDLVEGVKNGYFFVKDDPFIDNRVFKSMCLIITRNCNFSCKYCFAKESNKTEYRNAIMSEEIAKEALSFLVNASKERKSLEIDFFGGEPLLGFETIKSTVEYSKVLKEKYSKKFLFSLTTNASLLNDEIIDYLNKENISLILSLDGDKKTNDEYRVKSSGMGTFNETFGNIKKVLSKRNEGYYVRGTYTSKTINFPENVRFFYSSGVKKISIEPVVTKNELINLKEEDLTLLKKEYEELSKWYIDTKKADKELSFYHFELDLINGSCIEKLMSGCGASVEYLSVSPEGDLYPCHQFDGNGEFKLGDIYNGITNSSLTSTFRTATIVSNKKPCDSCWAKYLCGGGCLANNYTINNDINSTYSIGCEIQKLRLEAALFVQAKIHSFY